MSAGKINQEWYDGALCNGSHSDIERWFSEQTNSDCEIHRDRSVSCAASWLTQKEIDLFCLKIDGLPIFMSTEHFGSEAQIGTRRQFERLAKECGFEWNEKLITEWNGDTWPDVLPLDLKRYAGIAGSDAPAVTPAADLTKQAHEATGAAVTALKKLLQFENSETENLEIIRALELVSRARRTIGTLLIVKGGLK